MMVDASAIVAILAQEPEASELTRRLHLATTAVTHPMSIYESVLALCRLNEIPVEVARADVDDFLRRSGMNVVSITDATAGAALDAFSRFGRGRHPAALNMGDCFSYACAKLRGMPLLYKGDDFVQTDLA